MTNSDILRRRVTEIKADIYQHASEDVLNQARRFMENMKSAGIYSNVTPELMEQQCAELAKDATAPGTDILAILTFRGFRKPEARKIVHFLYRKHIDPKESGTDEPKMLHEVGLLFGKNQNLLDDITVEDFRSGKYDL